MDSLVNNEINYGADQTSKIEDFARQRSAAITSGVFFGANSNGQQVKWHFSLNTHVLEQRDENDYYDDDDDGYFYCIQIHCIFEAKTKDQNVEIQIENGNVGPSSGIIGQTNIDLKLNRDAILPNWLSSDGSLALRFKVTFIDNVLESTFSKQLHSLPPSTLVENFASLLQNEQFTDLIIIAKKKSFRAHKAILVARSTVFAAMFHDMQESQRNEITITDVKPEVVGEVLRFIYTDKVEGLPKMAHELLAAADKFDLARLKVMCEIQLCEGITAASATKTLLFADRHRAKELKAGAIEFLARNLKTVSNWEEFCSARSDLAAEILKKVASYN